MSIREKPTTNGKPKGVERMTNKNNEREVNFMNEETTEKIAMILGVSEDSVTVLPEDVKNAMVSAVNINDADTEENAAELYETLNALWTKGMIEVNLREIADHTGIDLTAMQNLDEETKHMLVFEYAMDSTNISQLYELIRSVLSVSELPKISRLLGVELSVLTALSPDTQRKICGHFAMMYEENGDNSVLFHELRTMME